MATVADIMQARLSEVRRMASELADAQTWVRQFETKLQNAAVAAAADQVPKSQIAAAAGVSRPTLYSWLSQE